MMKSKPLHYCQCCHYLDHIELVLFITRNETDKMTDFYLIGSSIERFVGRKPPTLRQILKIVLHKSVVLRHNLRASIRETLNDLVIFYDAQGIPTANVYKLTQKVEKIYVEWQGIRKNQTSTTDAQLKLRENFTKRLDKVFEVERVESKRKSVQTQTYQTPTEHVLKPGTKRISTSTIKPSVNTKRQRLNEIGGNKIEFANNKFRNQTGITT